MRAKIITFAVEVISLIIFTLLWNELEEFAVHGLEWMVGAAIIQQAAMNYLHGQAHHLTKHAIEHFTQKFKGHATHAKIVQHQ